MTPIAHVIPAVDGTDPGAAPVVRLLPDVSPTQDLARGVVAQFEGDCAPTGHPD